MSTTSSWADRVSRYGVLLLALTLVGGLIAFVVVLLRSTVGRFSPEKATSAIVVSYYWHFVDVVWIGLYATIYILQ